MFNLTAAEVGVNSIPVLSIEATGLDAVALNGVITGAHMHDMDQHVKTTGGVGTVTIVCKDDKGAVVDANTTLAIGTPVTINCTAKDTMGHTATQDYTVKPSKSARDGVL